MFFRKFIFRLASLLLLFALFIQAQPATRPLDLSGAVNRTFTDDVAGDEKGGWIDQGANDLRIIPTGMQEIGMVQFNILSDQNGKENSCIVLGKKKAAFLDEEATLTIAAPEKARTLYLLHAGDGTKTRNAIVGKLTATFTDGSKLNWNIRLGRDVQPWTGSQSGRNALRCWSEYNNSTQVSLFVSKFPLENKSLSSLRFSSEDALWMIAAASIGNDLRVNPLPTSFVMTQDFTAPPAIAPERLASVPTSGTPKNIIMIIGDGMGQGSLHLGSLHAHGELGKLVMQSLPVSGLCTTHSGNSDVTDSAASGTALSSGYKTTNGTLGLNLENEARQTIAELAKASGRAVGLMTTDSLTGATPSAYVSHVRSRSQSVEIANWYARSNFDLFIGAPNNKPFLPTNKAGMRADGSDLLAELTKSGYVQVNDDQELAAATQPVFGFIPWPEEQTLGKMTEQALPYLAKRSDKGFFIMIECSWPDSGGHGNNPNVSAKGALCTDYAVQAAVSYALQHRDTLVVVTADHETGQLSVIANKENPKRPHAVYQTTSHSQLPVPVFAFGPGAEKFHGVMDNIDIPKIFADFWQVKLGQPLPN